MRGMRRGDIGKASEKLLIFKEKIRNNKKNNADTTEIRSYRYVSVVRKGNFCKSGIDFLRVIWYNKTISGWISRTEEV